MRIVVATHNEHKIKEIKQILSNEKILSLKDIGFDQKIEETGTTFLENAIIKAKMVHKYLKQNHIDAYVIADDSGLCVDALNGAPGVYSSRYAGNNATDMENRNKLLNDLKNEYIRQAHFICYVVEYFPDGSYIYASAKTSGNILESQIGDTSFGYDCLFFSFDLCKSFGLATDEEKNRVSHRARALKELVNIEKQLISKR